MILILLYLMPLIILLGTYFMITDDIITNVWEGNNEVSRQLCSLFDLPYSYDNLIKSTKKIHLIVTFLPVVNLIVVLGAIYSFFKD